MSSDHQNQIQRPKKKRAVRKLPLLNYDHWNSVSTEHWISCGIEPRPEYADWRDPRIHISHLKRAMVRIQHSLKAAKLRGDEDNAMVLDGEILHYTYGGYPFERKRLRCPYHEDLLPNFKRFANKLKKYKGKIERFNINKVMLPPSFFSNRIMSVLNENITTIISLKLVDVDLKNSDVDSISKFVKKNVSLEVLNLSTNVLFGSEDGYNAAAKLLSKSMKKHPELSYVNLTSTGLGVNNEALKLLLEGVKDINSFIMEDREGFTTMANFLEKKKNSITVFSMGGMHLSEEDNSKANAKALGQCLTKNTTLEQLSLASNKFGSNDRIFSTVMSGMKGSESLVYVDLSSNEIRRMPTVKLLAKYLRNNSSLVGLDLSFNKLPTKSADVLMKALKKNTTLEDLCLANNNIGDKSVESFTDMLQNNSTLKSLDLQGNNLKIQTGRKGMFKALCDTTSLDAIASNSNHTCCIIIAGKNYGDTYEDELNKINSLDNEGEKIRYKVVLALCQMNKDLYNPNMFNDVPLELMPKVLELIQLEIGCNGYGEGITNVVTKKRSSKKDSVHLSKLYDAIHQWPAFPSLFSRGPGKGCLTKTGKLKRKREKRAKVSEEDEDWAPSGARKMKRRRWRWMPEEHRWYLLEPEPAPPSRSSSRSTATVSYVDVENSEDES